MSTIEVEFHNTDKDDNPIIVTYEDVSNVWVDASTRVLHLFHDDADEVTKLPMENVRHWVEPKRKAE